VFPLYVPFFHEPISFPCCESQTIVSEETLLEREAPKRILGRSDGQRERCGLPTWLYISWVGSTAGVSGVCAPPPSRRLPTAAFLSFFRPGHKWQVHCTAQMNHTRADRIVTMLSYSCVAPQLLSRVCQSQRHQEAMFQLEKFKYDYQNLYRHH